METLQTLKYDWLHSKLVLDSPPTLFQQATVKIASNAWLEEETYVYLLRDSHIPIYDIILNVVTNKIRFLNLPKKVKNAVAEMTELVGEQLSAVLRVVSDFLGCRNLWKDKIYWTAQGTIDKRRTAEALADSADLDVETRLKVAVVFYLEDRINSLSIQMPNDYYDRNSEWFEKFNDIADMDGVTIAKKHFNISKQSQDTYERMFEKMLKTRNDLGCGYYWQLLTEDEKRDALYFNHEIALYTHGLFLFIHRSEERRLEFLQNDRNCFRILCELSTRIEWFPIFYATVRVDVLKLLNETYLNCLLTASVDRVQWTVAFKNKYAEICVVLVEFLLSFPSLSSDSNECIMESLNNLLEENEKELVKYCLQSLRIEWIKQQFSLCGDATVHFLTVSFKCGMLQSIFSSVLPTVDERHEFLDNNELDSVILGVIESCYQMENVDEFLSELFFNFEDVDVFKSRFFETKGCKIFSKLFEQKNWKVASQFVQTFLVSEEKILCFYNKFFRSLDFRGLFNFNINKILARQQRDIVALIKENKLENQLSNNELMLEACLIILSEGFYNWNNIDVCLKEMKAIFEVLDTFLLAILCNDEKKLSDVKIKLFIDTERKLYISFPLEYRNNFIKFYRGDELDKRWHALIDEFFSWICSSDDTLKDELKEEFWKSEEVVQAIAEN